MQLVIISHTEHYLGKNGTIKGWGSTVRELNHVAEICDELIHLAPLHTDPAPDSSLVYASDKIKFVPLKPSGGKGLQKLSILTTAIDNLKKIHKYSRSADFIQFRAPTGMGLYVLPYLKWFRAKKYWVKYAGNWVDPEMPLGNRLQKDWLKHIDLTVKVTINGKWEQQERFLSFENPSLTKEEHIKGKQVVAQKTQNITDKLRLIFVGSLTRHKGVHLILEAIRNLEDLTPFSELIFVGDGADRYEFQESALSLDLPVQFLGHCSKNEVAKLLIQSHVLLLPSKSEGFPKVVGEAMNFGCIPIVSDVSCISDYIETENNGFLLEAVTSSVLQTQLQKLALWQDSDIKKALLHNSGLASRFTYEYYNEQLVKTIFNSNH